MALRQGSEHYTKWTHMENGQVMVRRLHRMEVQARDGRLHILTGDRLPDFIGTSTGQGYKGAHLAQILLSPESIAIRSPRQDSLSGVPSWPLSRDVVHMALGVIGFLLIRFLMNLIVGIS